MSQLNTSFRRAPLALALGLGVLAVPALAQSPAGAMPGSDGKPKMERSMERMAERIKDRCEKMEERLASMDKKLTADQVRDIIAGRLAESGNPNIKVGKTALKDGVVTVEIVTKDGSLINTRQISTKTGLPVEIGQRCDKIEERIEKARAEMDEHGPGERNHKRGAMGKMGGGLRGFGLIGGEIGPDRDLNLTAAQVKTLAESRLIMLGNPRLKVGAVKEKDKNTYTVDIVTVDNSLVLTREVDKHTGRQHRG